ncbi:type IV secretion system DNA-binding domain-containing protein [bacterium]|nr:type IV secretion system DNA-binding domain-containing protein [bacterium]
MNLTPTRRDWPTTAFLFLACAAAGVGAIAWSSIQIIEWVWHVNLPPTDALQVAISAVYDVAGEWPKTPFFHRVYAALPLAVGIPLTLLISWWVAKVGGMAPPDEKQLAGHVLTDDDQHAARTARDESHSQRGGEGLQIHPSIRISRDRETRGIGVIGSIGGGKTTVLQPLIGAALARGDRCIVLDIKGDYSSGLLDQPGVATLAPWDLRGVAWDLATDIDTTSAAEEFAARIIPVSKGDNPMWANGARSILTGAIISQMRVHPGNWTLSDVGSLVVAPYSYFRRSVVQAYPTCGAFLPEKPTNTTTSFLANLGAFLTPIYKLADAWSFEGHGQTQKNISLRDWLTKSASETPYQCLILGGHGAHEQTARGLAQAALGYLRSIVASPDLPDNPSRRIWLFLDEVAQLGKIEGLERFVEIGRSKGVCTVFGAQDISQIRQHYGPEVEKTWTASVGTWIIARSLGPDSQQWLSKMVGDGRWERSTKSITRGSFLGGQVAPTETTSSQVEERPVIRPEEFGEGMGPIQDERGFWARLFGTDFEGGVRAHLFCPDWHHVYRLDWPYSHLPGSTSAVVYAPWALPGWPDSASAAQSALAEAGCLISSDAGDPPASDEHDDDGEPIRPPTSPRLPGGGATTVIPASPAIDPELLPVFDDPTPARTEAESEHEGALEALGEKAAENLIADTLGDDVAHAAELAGHVIDALNPTSPGSSDAPRIVTRADALRARLQARREKEQEQDQAHQDQNHDGPEPGQ